MNSNQLKQFIAIAEEENITRASQKLFISQSALSNTLKLLEEELDCQLFDRKSNRLILNANGTKLFGYAKQAIRLIEAAEKEFKTMNKKREINIATSSHLYFSAFFKNNASLLREFHLKVIESSYRDIFDFLERKNCDAAIAPGYPPIHKNLNRFDHIKLGEEQLLVCFPSDHPYSEKKSVSIEELNGEQFVSFENDIDFRWQDYLFMSKGCSIEYCAELPRGYTQTNDISNLTFPCFYTSLVKQKTINDGTEYKHVQISNPEAKRDIYLYYKPTSKDFVDSVIKKFL